MSLNELCRIWRAYKTPTAIESISARHLLTDSEISLVRAGQIAIGMSENALYWSWGFPSGRNRTVTATSTQVQNIYGGTYVYTENGTVTAWQD